MFEREEGFSTTILSALGAVLAVVCLAGIAAVGGWVMLALDHSANGAVAQRERCNICGVVEQVREIEQRGPFSVGLSGGMGGMSGGSRPASMESLVVLIAAIGGHNGGAAKERERLYEVSVRLRDGSVRVLRDSTPPTWKAGDQVKVIRGRIEAVS